MSPYRRSALFLIRLVAFGLILFTVLWVALSVFASKAGKQPEAGWHVLALKVVPGVLGLFLFAKSGAIARRLTEDFEE